MIKLVVTNEKNLELTELEKVHVGENKFGYYLIFLPENLNDYNLTECEVKLIQVFEDNTSVAIDIDTSSEERPIKEFITLDATSQAQMVTLSVLITHNGNVIGKTNQKTFQVYPTKNATPIDPREELDEIIAGLRADKAELEETVSEQAETITSQGNQITELSGEIADLNSEVTELTSENTRLENLTDTQRETIQHMLDNPPEPSLYTPPNAIIPSKQTQTFTPPPTYDGLASVTVDRVDTTDISDFLDHGIDELDYTGEVYQYFLQYCAIPINKLTLHTSVLQGYVLYNSPNVKFLSCPETTVLSAYTLTDSSNLKSINLPNVLYANERALFNLQALENLNLNKFERLNARYILNNSSSLRSLYLPSLNYNDPGLSGNFIQSAIEALIFKQPSIVLVRAGFLTSTPISNGNGYIYVPDDYVNSYKTATNWTIFADQITGYSSESNAEVGDTYTPTYSGTVDHWDNVIVNGCEATTNSSTGVTTITKRGVFDEDYSSHVMIRALNSNGVPVHCEFLHVK